MIEPRPEDVGRRVVYRPKHWTAEHEVGVISSFSSLWVFVRYGAPS